MITTMQTDVGSMANDELQWQAAASTMLTHTVY